MLPRGYSKDLIKSKIMGISVLLKAQRSSDGLWTKDGQAVGRYSFHRERRVTENKRIPYRIFILFAGEWSFILALGLPWRG